MNLSSQERLPGESFSFTQPTLPSTPPTSQQSLSSSQGDFCHPTPRTPMSTPLSLQLSQPTLFGAPHTTAGNACAHNSPAWTNIFRPAPGSGANLYSLSTPYHPSSSFPNANKVMGRIDDLEKRIQRFQDLILTEKEGSVELIKEVKGLLESNATETITTLEMRDKKLEERLEVLLKTVEIRSDKSEEVNNVTQEGLKQLGERVEVVVTEAGKIEERQECMLKEIELEHLCSRQTPLISEQTTQLPPLNPSHKRLPQPDEQQSSPLDAVVQRTLSASAGSHPPIIIYNISNGDSRPMSRNSNSSSLAWDGDTAPELMQMMIKRRKLALEEWMEGVQNL